MHAQEDAATLTHSRYLCKREGLGSHWKDSFSLGSRLATMVFVSTEPIPPAFVSANPSVKRHSENQLHGSVNYSIRINQSSIPYNHSAICIIPLHVPSDTWNTVNNGWPVWNLALYQPVVRERLGLPHNENQNINWRLLKLPNLYLPAVRNQLMLPF